MIFLTDKDLMDKASDEALSGFRFALGYSFSALSSVNGDDFYLNQNNLLNKFF